MKLGLFLLFMMPLLAVSSFDDDLALLTPEELVASYDQVSGSCTKIDNSNGTIARCESEAAKILEQALDQQIKLTKEKLGDSSEGRELYGRLMMAHGSWLSFRSSECQFKGAMRRLGGSGEGVDILRCHNQLTIDRIHELQKLEL